MHRLTVFRLAPTWVARLRLGPGGPFSSLTSFKNQLRGYKTARTPGELHAKVSKPRGTVDKTDQVQLDDHFCLARPMLQSPDVFTMKIGFGCFSQLILHTSLLQKLEFFTAQSHLFDQLHADQTVTVTLLPQLATSKDDKTDLIKHDDHNTKLLFCSRMGHFFSMPPPSGSPA